MDWVSRFLGLPVAQSRLSVRTPANDPVTRLARFKRTYQTALALCNQPRQIANEGPLLEQLRTCLDKLVTVLREESRAPAPHICLQFSNASQVYALAGQAAVVSQHEGVVRSAVSIYATLVDSEEEGFLSSSNFAKSLMRFVTRILDNGTNPHIETAICELLFTVTASIRLQPSILGVWFQHRSKKARDEANWREKQNFVGAAQKEDFPLCYLLIDRVHNEGRVGDFARTGLLYIFEATGRSAELEAWILSSDLATLMASGLGALYSQLSRELSILHPDATLPAVLAMSDYSTTHHRATATSAFADHHKNAMSTFLSYLAFWQDVLDHCRSDDVKEALLDHFQILFVQQLLYPSLLQSSDVDAGSSVAVLIYMTAMLESLHYPDLTRMMLSYLLATSPDLSDGEVFTSLPYKSNNVPKSPQALRRRQSLLLMTAPIDPAEAVDPHLFNLADLILNNISSVNDQAAFAALKLAATLVQTQKQHVFRTLLEVETISDSVPSRTFGAAHLEIEQMMATASLLHDGMSLDGAYHDLCEDVRFVIEAQTVVAISKASNPLDPELDLSGRYILQQDSLLLKHLIGLLNTFWSNSIDVNLAATQLFASIAMCVDLRLDGWLALDPSVYAASQGPSTPLRPWEEHLDTKDAENLASAAKAATQPNWPSNEQAPPIYSVLTSLVNELDSIRNSVANFDALVHARKSMLQATSISIPTTPDASVPASPLPSPTKAAYLDIPQPKVIMLSRETSRSGSPVPDHTPNEIGGSASPALRSLFRPPPPETANTTDFLMQSIVFPANDSAGIRIVEVGEVEANQRSASLNHILTNVVILQEFVLELAAIIYVRAAVLGERDVKFVV